MYTPMIRTRQSELIGIRALSSETKTLCRPLFDLAGPTRPTDIARPQAYTERNIARLKKCVEGFKDAFVDSSELDATLRLTGGVHPIIAAAKAIKDAGANPIPVTGLHRDVEHMNSVFRIGNSLGNGTVCVRLDATDIGTARISYKSLMTLLQSNGIDPSHIILLLDFQSVFAACVDVLVAQVLRFLEFVSVSQWQAAIIAGYGLPEQISREIHVRDQGYIPRLEQDAFFRIVDGKPTQRVWFGDYTSVAPTHVELDMRIISRTMGPKAVYALENSWFVVRGGPFVSEADGYRQYYTLASKIVALEDFPGDPDFSYGDRYIFDRSTGSATTTGGPASWITASVNRHATLTARSHNRK
jgi:hypothetical protein